MNKILSEKIFKYSLVFAVVWLALLAPLIKFMPDYLAYENCLVENTKILLLFIGMLISAYNVKKIKPRLFSPEEFFATNQATEYKEGTYGEN